MCDWRICTKCWEFKEWKYFYKDKMWINWYKAECKACFKDRMQEAYKEQLKKRAKRFSIPVKIKPDNCPEITLEMLQQMCPKENILSSYNEECSER